MKASKGGLILVAVILLGLLAYWSVTRDAAAPPTADPTSSAQGTQRGKGASPKGTPKSTAKPTGGATDPQTGLVWIDEAALPKEARQTLRLIDAGGPYPYDKDGVVFGNFEGILPKKPRGYYHEYTVPTPGARDRGARRIVTGDQQYFWTEDHYASFQRIRR